MSCKDTAPLLTQVVDGTADSETVLRVRRHLSACAVCRALGEKERRVHDLLTARAEALRGHAPLALRVRVRANALRPASPAVAIRWRAVAAAAACLLVVGGLQFVPLQSASLHAAQLALDHVQCWYLWEHVDQGDGEASAERDVQAQTGWTVRLPPSNAGVGLTLVRARRCPYFYGPHAHSLYRFGEREVSLYIGAGNDAGVERVHMLGHDERFWQAGGRRYGLVARGLSPNELDRVETYFRETAR